MKTVIAPNCEHKTGRHAWDWKAAWVQWILAVVLVAGTPAPLDQEQELPGLGVRVLLHRS